MPSTKTSSEELTYWLCKKSFLKLWTHPNPIGKKGKELCDCLIVCGPDIIIFSVKEVQYKETGDHVGFERWLNTALEKSVKQIYGAERWLHTVDRVLCSDGRTIELPRKEDRTYHRISVSLGSNRKIPLRWGGDKRGFFHIFDERNLEIIMKNLDSIRDFIDFLVSVENLTENINVIIDGGGTEDLLAHYLMNKNSFDSITNNRKNDRGILILSDDLWHGFSNSPEYKKHINDIKISYFWDHLIEHYTDDLLTDGMFDFSSKEITTNQLALVEMAKQPRWARLELSKALIDLRDSESQKVGARLVKISETTAFVFMVRSSKNREDRAMELSLRCLVARGRVGGITTVVGIAIDPSGPSSVGYSSDILYLCMPNWSEDDEFTVCGIQKDLGYFKNLTS